MTSPVTANAAGNVIKYYALQNLRRYLADWKDCGNAYLCVRLAKARFEVAPDHMHHIEALIDHIQQELATGALPPHQRGMVTYLYYQGLIPYAVGVRAADTCNMARAAWVDKMIEQFETAINEALP